MHSGNERPTPSAIALPWRVLDDVIHSDDHLCRLCRRAELRHLAPEGLHDAQLLHVSHATRGELQAGGVLSFGVRCSQLPRQLRRVQASIVGEDDWDLRQGFAKSLHGCALLAAHLRELLLHLLRHGHLHGAAAPNNSRLLHCLVQHCQGIVQGAFGLVQDVRGAASQHDGASFAFGAARELDDLVFPNHDLFDLFARAKRRQLWVIKSGDNVCSENSGQALGTIEVRMLDRHDPRLLEQLIRIVVDQLPVDEDIALVCGDLLYLCLHLLLLGLLDLRHGFQGVHLHPGTIDLDFVRVHLTVCHQNLAIFEQLLMANTNPLLQDEALLQEGVLQGGARLFQHLDVVQIGLATQTKNCIDGQRRKMVLLVL
mmetsp:Transcript_36275/g.75690  ORF Transcript_36275/g.75690 Transcript_36275/m.75690 type:complete len:370 (-) Transcript_36275:593-1702(-)